jgi:mono/diheme cytochrome c family protein
MVPLRALSVVPAIFGLALMSAGCERAEPVQWDSSEQVKKLAPELGQQVTKIVNENAGSVLKPKMVSEKPSEDNSKTVRRELQLKHGQAVYMKRCVQCHGVSGDGMGPVADSLYPRPRDYTKGIFKFTSTPYGSKPRRDDLIATLRRGVTGTSMPAFRLLPKEDIEDVVDYIILLAQRGELEVQLANEAEASEELDPDYISEFIDDVGAKWKDASGPPTQPLTPQPELTQERIALGREAFLTKGCSKCHAEDGRGHTKDNIGKDAWGHATRAADLTSGMLRGGQEPIDIYRRILNGINGTPMPGFRNALESEPDTVWNLVSYVLYVSDRRREGVAIPAGLIKPYTEAPAAAAEGEAAPAGE